MNDKNREKRLNITLPPELIEELEKVNKKYKINKSSQIETLIIKYLRKEYGDLDKKEPCPNKILLTMMS